MGRFIGFDGENIQVETEYGALTLRYISVSCAGDPCPDLSTYVPEVRFSGASLMAEILVPSLVEGFARSKGLQVTFEQIDPLHFRQTLFADAVGTPVGRFVFHVATTDEGFADLIAHEADIVLSLREVRAEEVRRGREVGLGQLDGPRQSRIVGLDALVPVVSPRSSVAAISLTQIAAAFAGDFADWADVGEDAAPMTLHLGPATDGQAQRFIDEVVRGSERILSPTVVHHDSYAALAAAVVADPGALGILSATALGATQPISLRDNCGFVSAPRVDAMKTDDYPLTAPLFLYLPSRRLPSLAGDFLAWLRGPEAQLVVRRAGFVDQGAVPVPLNTQGHRFANAIVAAGDEIPLAELQRMVRVLGTQVRISTSFRFDVVSTRLDAQSRSNLLSLAQAIRDGRYDGRGSAEANRELSSARAVAVLRDLETLMGGRFPEGVVVETEAFGEALPMGCDDTEWGRQINRRVELWVAE